MLQQVGFPLRTECPPGACVCERERLLAEPDADLRPLRLTRMEEQKLIDRIEGIASYEELKRLQEKIRSNLGVELKITPSPNEVRTLRGIVILLEDRPGLCKKVRQSIPAAVRKALERHPEITYAILDANDLFGM
ncbi:hypothetical protein SRABI118_01369 [Massilia sp. Bi118]|uniref:hypothetical protein n=1 Tax=Massilia sp. Bi118 TaxID=2822346 RepID=UPI001D1D71F3|nr:hypothetical protein [Massilia sp. Bi118]CAH0185982.1 hypothetical protein SRABI118_01369 [Massilia sp. Bi118]